MKNLPKIVVDSNICHGKPIIEGTRIMVWQILELLEAGESETSINKAYPTLPKGAIKSALHYAAERAKSERYVSFQNSDKTHVFA